MNESIIDNERTRLIIISQLKDQKKSGVYFHFYYDLSIQFGIINEPTNGEKTGAFHHCGKNINESKVFLLKSKLKEVVL